MDTAAGENGVTEDERKGICCPSIKKYIGAIDSKWREYMSHDEKKAWCACFAAWVLKENGFGTQIPKGVKSIKARSYSQCWCKTDKPVFGAMVIMHGPGRQGHVGFVAGVTDSEVIVIGGNQDNKVQPSRYNKKGKTGGSKGVTIKEYRYPCGKDGKAKNGQAPIDYSGWNVDKIDKKSETR